MSTEPVPSPASPSPEASTVQSGSAPVAAVPIAVSGTRVPRELPPRRLLSKRALLFGLAVAVAVPLLFLASAVAFLIATNYNILDWME